MPKLLTKKYLDLLQQGVSFITPNQRLALYIQQYYDQYQHEQGLALWDSPDILPLNAWFTRMWMEVSEEIVLPALLTPDHAVIFFEKIIYEWQSKVIAQDPIHGLLNIYATAKAAYQAWQLIFAYQIDIENKEDSYHSFNQDSLVFMQWYQAFKEKLLQDNWQDLASMPDKILTLIETKKITLTKKIVFAGFEEQTPQQQSFFAHLKKLKYKVDFWDKPLFKKAKIGKISALNKEEEAWQAAVWIKEKLQKGASQVALVVPDLAKKRALIERTLQQVLQPESVLPQAHETAAMYNFTVGFPLQNYPLINMALKLLHTAIEPIKVEDIIAILQSPFINGNETTGRAKLVVVLLNKLKTEFTWRDILNLEELKDCPLFAEKITAFLEQVQALADIQTPQAWAKTFSLWLKIWGWPGDRQKNSAEYQTVSDWLEMLSKFAGLSAVLPLLDLSTALSHLNRITHDKIFQPKPARPAPVQVLTPMEAENLLFDAIWFMGLEDNNWPSLSQANPFIPIHWQRYKKIPNASPEQDLNIANRITQNILYSAPEVMVSYPNREGEEALRPSLLIKDIDFKEPKQNTIENIADIIFNSSELEEKPEYSLVWRDKEPPVSSRALQLQAACPFRAFAEYRLHAVEWIKPEPYLKAHERGSILHDILHEIWERIRTQKELQKLYHENKEKLRNIVEKAVEKLLSAWQRKRPDVFHEVYYQLENKRLTNLVYKWLTQKEIDRPPFKLFHAEQKIKANLAGVPLNLRLDRLDQLENGNYVLIDYKTGQCSPSDWEGERPDDPQLPLYAIVSQYTPSALIFAQIHPDKMRFVGQGKEEDSFTGVSAVENWEEQFEQWKITLTNLAQQLYEGKAQIDPKDYPQTCQYCHLGALCRIAEQAYQAVDF